MSEKIPTALSGEHLIIGELYTARNGNRCEIIRIFEDHVKYKDMNTLDYYSVTYKGSIYVNGMSSEHDLMAFWVESPVKVTTPKPVPTTVNHHEIIVGQFYANGNGDKCEILSIEDKKVHYYNTENQYRYSVNLQGYMVKDRSHVLDLVAPWKEIENPKKQFGAEKYSSSSVPACVIGDISLGTLEGNLKYGFYNYRGVKIEAKTYYDAAERHLKAWWEGEDIDPDSGLNHITKALSSLVIMRDAMINENIVDNRPPKAKAGWIKELNEKTKQLMEKYASVS